MNAETEMNPEGEDVDLSDLDFGAGELTEDRLETVLAEILTSRIEEELPGAKVRTYGDAGVPTLNRGLVLQVNDSEFRVQISRSANRS